MHPLLYSDYPYTSYVTPPPRVLNGGLYTGEPFKANSEYGNVPVIPDTGYMTHYNLRSANPPPDAIFQYPGSIRPGNNFQLMTGVGISDKKYNLGVNEAQCKSSTPSCKCKACSFSKYAYL